MKQQAEHFETSPPPLSSILGEAGCEAPLAYPWVCPRICPQPATQNHLHWLRSMGCSNGSILWSSHVALLCHSSSFCPTERDQPPRGVASSRLLVSAISFVHDYLCSIDEEWNRDWLVNSLLHCELTCCKAKCGCWIYCLFPPKMFFFFKKVFDLQGCVRCHTWLR